MQNFLWVGWFSATNLTNLNPPKKNLHNRSDSYKLYLKIDWTGPNISSLAILMWSWTLEKTVGWIKYPLSRAFVPPHSTLAPSSLPLWIISRILSNWALSTWKGDNEWIKFEIAGIDGFFYSTIMICGWICKLRLISGGNQYSQAYKS